MCGWEKWPHTLDGELVGGGSRVMSAQVSDRYLPACGTRDPAGFIPRNIFAPIEFEKLARRAPLP